MYRVLPAGLLLAILSVAPHISGAQSSIDASRAVAAGRSQTAVRPELEDLTYAVFSRRDGLTDGAIYSVTQSHDGDLLLGTSEGGKHYTGRRWESLPYPPNATEIGVRVVIDAGDTGRYYVYDRWASLEKGGKWLSHTQIPADQGPIYSAALYQRTRENAQLVIGAAGGVFTLDDSGSFQRLNLPEQAVGRDVMVATRQTSEGAELWVGSRGEGIFRLINGKWTVWGKRNGLGNLAVEQVVPSPTGDSVTAAVATEDGAYLLVNNEWRPVGPKISISRVKRVRVRDSIETWLGTATGHIYRSADGVFWKPLAPIPRTVGSRVQMIEAIDTDSYTPTVLIGFRSGVLLRITFGPGGRVILPPALTEHSVTAVTGSFHNDSLWFWAMDYGAFRLPDFASVLSLKIPVVSGDPRAIVFVDTLSRPSHLLAAYDWRLFEQQGKSWKELINAGERQAIHTILRAPSPANTSTIVAITPTGAWYESSPSQFKRWPDFPTGSRSAVLDTSSGQARIVLMMNDGRVLYSSGGAWSEIRADLAASSVVEQIGVAIKAVLAHLPSGECVLIVGGSHGLGVLRTCKGKPEWQLLDANSVIGLLGPDVTDLRLLPNNELAIGSSRGLTLVKLGSTFSDTIRVVDSFTDQDGLPHPYITALGPLDRQQRIWLGTPLGVGFVRLDSISRRNEQPVIALIRVTDAIGERVHSGTKIGNTSARLQIDAFMTTFHRDEETMFRFELDGIPMTTPAWTTQPSATLPILPPGQHSLRIRAADYRGMEAESRYISFSVLPPFWRSPVALIAYGITFLIGIVLFDRLRNHNTLRRAREAEANERKLSSSELRFRRLFEDGINAQLLVSDGMILQANKAACTLLDVNATELLGRPLSLVVPLLSMKETKETRDAYHNVDVHVSGEYEIQSSRHDTIPVEVSHTRIPLDNTVLDHFEMRDLRERNRLEAERQRLENQLRDAQRLESVGTLAGGVAHDFNNLLTVIHTNAELAAADISTGSTAGQALQQLLTASDRARLVVRQILTFSRKTEQHREPVCIQTLLEETHSLLRSTIPSTIQLVIDNRANDAVVIGDATQLQQLLLNLCSNAEYAMRDTRGGTLSIDAEWITQGSANEVGTIALRVTDTGHGISEDVQARMFEPFYTTKPVGEGTGLGLSVLHGIVNSHSGTISVASKPGTGACFEVRFPASRCQSIDSSKPQAISKRPDDSRLRILVVDDEEAVLTAIRRLLERTGFEVISATNGVEALAAIQSDMAFDVILTDQTMPHMTGTELAEQLRSSGNNVPVIIASGFGSVIESSRISHLPNVQRIDKPFSSQDLTELLKKTAGSSQAESQSG